MRCLPIAFVTTLLIFWSLCCAERALPLTMNEMLLRGCMLKNSNYVLGLVVYTGQESRIQMNAAKTPNKVGGSSSAASLLVTKLSVSHASFPG